MFFGGLMDFQGLAHDCLSLAPSIQHELRPGVESKAAAFSSWISQTPCLQSRGTAVY